MIAGHPLEGGSPEGRVYQARMRRPPKLDMITLWTERVFMRPSMVKTSLSSTTSTLASMSTSASASLVCSQNLRTFSTGIVVPLL